MLLLGNLETGDVVRDERGQFWVCKDGEALLYTDELGLGNPNRRHIYPENRGMRYESPVTRFTPPVMKDGMSFYLVSNFKKNQPEETFIFGYSFTGWRFKVQCKNYRITIPNYYQSTDPRAGQLCADWTCKGQILARIRQGIVFTMHGEDKPTLDIALKGQTIRVCSM